jgi:hypothetical protein
MRAGREAGDDAALFFVLSHSGAPRSGESAIHIHKRRGLWILGGSVAGGTRFSAIKVNVGLKLLCAVKVIFTSTVGASFSVPPVHRPFCGHSRAFGSRARVRREQESDVHSPASQADEALPDQRGDRQLRSLYALRQHHRQIESPAAIPQLQAKELECPVVFDPRSDVEFYRQPHGCRDRLS